MVHDDLWYILQAEFMETKPNGHIHRYETSISGNIVVYVSKPINDNRQILSRLLDSTCQVPSLHRKQDFCCIPCIINSCMEEV